MDSIIFLSFTVAYLILLAWGGWLAARKRHWWTPANIPLLVVAALVYDNLIIGIGRWVGEGPVLEGLNLARFWIHATVTPLLVAWALHALRRAGLTWAQGRRFQFASISAAVGLMVLEYFAELRGLAIAPEEEYGALSYPSAGPSSGPPIMVLIVAAFLLAVGALLWWKQRWPWLFIGAVIMTIGSAVDLPVASGAITNAFELVLLISILATKAFQDKRERIADAERRR